MIRRLFFSILIIFVLTAFFIGCSPQKQKSSTLNFAFYNVENLFDTIDDPSIRDEDFLPTADNPWNSERYHHKLEQMARVMSDIVPGGFPDVFGLCEVENRDVVEDLMDNTKLNAAGYALIHQDSPDERGIDVAMLYRPDVFNPVVVKYMPVRFMEQPDNSTRDLLYVKGLVDGHDTLHLVIGHWVSRWGGQEATDPLRRHIASMVRHLSDSIMSYNANANILIAGDLNDNPTDPSVAEVLAARRAVDNPEAGQVYNLGLAIFEEGQGSLYYRSWDLFDQIIVSPALLTGNGGLQVCEPRQTIIKHDYMLFVPREGEPRPNRTASGKKYFGGFSDHLPVAITMNIR